MTRYPHRSAALLLALTVLMTISPVPLTAAVSVGDHPKLNFKATDGTLITSEVLKGRIVIVDFWATWCGPCVKAMPHMTQLNQEYASQGVQIIGVSLDSDRGSLAKFVRKHNLPWPQYYDGRGWKNKLAQAWGVNSIPRTFLLSPDGEVLWSGHPNGLDKQLQQAMQSHPPRLDEVGSKSDSQSASANQARDEAVDAIQQARTAINDGDFTQMLSLIAQVPDEVLTDRRVLGNARVLLAKLQLAEDQADAFTSAKEANPDAAARLDAITQAVNHQATAADTDSAGPKVHPKLVAAKLAQASKAHDAEDYARAYRLYNWLLDRASETDEGHAAAQRIAEYEADDARMAVIRAAEAEQKAKALLTLANAYNAAGKHDLARQTYEQVLAEHPDAEKCCDKARTALADLD